MSSEHQLSVSPTLINHARQAGPIRCIFECGSRDALDGLALFDALRPDELHAFECNPQAIALCQANIARSPYRDNVHLAQLAVADKSGVLSFNAIDPKKTVTPHADGNIGASSLYVANPEYPHEKYVQNVIEVQSTSLDDYCRNHSTPDLLWMDLQGAEAMAIDGAKTVLPKVKIIYVEVSFRPMYLGQALFRDVDKRLRGQFTLADLDIGRWPKLPGLYSALNFGPWIGNAIYINKNLKNLS